MEIKTKIVGIGFPSCIFNASGPLCTSLEELKNIGRSAAGAIVLKSATFRAREGNEKPRYFENGEISINSMGLPNPGFRKLAALIPRLKRFKKPIIASVAGFSKEEYLIMLEIFDKAGADVIELNLSCPNIPNKPQAGYNFEYSEEVLSEAREKTKKPIAVKLPPYLEIVHQQTMAEILVKNKIEIVVLVNSAGNALLVDIEKESAVIKPKKGLGGMGGEFIKPIALGNVWSFCQLLGKKIEIIGVGGINSGNDVFEYLLCGASAVQVGTAFAKEGTKIFERLERELQTVMQKKGYEHIEEFKGKLKEVGEASYGFSIE